MPRIFYLSSEVLKYDRQGAQLLSVSEPQARAELSPEALAELRRYERSYGAAKPETRYVVVSAPPHLNANKLVGYRALEVVMPWHLDELEEELAGWMTLAGPAPTGVAMVTQYVERGETSYHHPRTTHRAVDGRPACCAKLGEPVSKPERWDPWHKVTCPPREETPVWVPSFAPVSCKRCERPARVKRPVVVSPEAEALSERFIRELEELE